MKKTDKQLLNIHYKAACNDYAYELMRQWELSTEDCWWAADEVGGIWCFNAGECFINMQEIIYCIENDVTFGTYLRYMDYYEDCCALGLSTCNLMNYCKGAGIYSQETLQKLHALKNEMNSLLDDAKNKKPF